LLLIRNSVTAAGDTGDVVGKVIVGYHGWFNAAGDGSPMGNWQKWVGNGAAPGPNNMIVSIYPDTREYPVLFQTALANLGNGQPAKLFSSYSTQTIDLHFQWMQTYGIDGAALQRFTSSGNYQKNADSISARMMRAAEKYGRKIYIMYDISQMGSNFDQVVEQDWTNTIANALHLINSPAYAKQNGKTVVCLWGIGFNDGVQGKSVCLDKIKTNFSNHTLAIQYGSSSSIVTPLSIELLNVQGKTVLFTKGLSRAPGENKILIDCSALAKGTYLSRINAGQKQVVGKVVMF
jgi:hypothetical protein